MPEGIPTLRIAVEWLAQYQRDPADTYQTLCTQYGRTTANEVMRWFEAMAPRLFPCSALEVSA